MTNRGLLWRQMRETWPGTIRSAYMDQVIRSERALQVHFTARLLDLLWEDGVKRLGFVEPRTQVNIGARVHLDRLICNARDINGVVGLKYNLKIQPDAQTISATRETWPLQICVVIDNAHDHWASCTLRWREKGSLGIQPLQAWTYLLFDLCFVLTTT